MNSRPVGADLDPFPTWRAQNARRRRQRERRGEGGRIAYLGIGQAAAALVTGLTVSGGGALRHADNLWRRGRLEPVLRPTHQHRQAAAAPKHPHSQSNQPRLGMLRSVAARSVSSASPSLAARRSFRDPQPACTPSGRRLSTLFLVFGRPIPLVGERTARGHR